MDKSKPSAGKIVGLGRGALESPARPFDALGELGVAHRDGEDYARLEARVIESLKRDVFLGQACAYAQVAEPKFAHVSVAELQRTVLLCEAIQRQSPFQLSQFMPKDCPHLCKIEGKYYFGLYRWKEFNNALCVSESKAMALLREWQVLDIDAACAEHQRKWGEQLDADIKAKSPDVAARFRKAFHPVA